MTRPRIFLSAVSEELRSTRQAAAATVRTLGFDPVSQDDFPTGYGELRNWLREQIDSCEGLVQLVGHGYGAEPAAVDPDYGRVSYTQFEFLYAGRRGKKTRIIVIGDGCRRDKPIDKLDLPDETGHPDPAGYQNERQKLQQDYIARLTHENHLRYTANNDTELQNIILRLRDELGELRQREERKQRRLTRAIIAVLLGIVVLIGGGWWAYKSLSTSVQQVAVVDTEKIRAHLLQTAEETHRRELAEAEAITDWKERQRLREAADNAHAARLTRIEELSTSFAEIEGRGTATNVFQEMTRILSEQGVDEAIAYVATQRSTILKTVQARAAAARDRNRADMQPLLRAAGLYEAKGQTVEARTLYADILDADSDWPEALNSAFWFHINQGDIGRVRSTLTDAQRDYEEAHRIAQHLIAGDPTNNEWQHDLFVAYDKLGGVAEAQGQLVEAERAYGESLAIAKKLSVGDPSNTLLQRNLSVTYNRLGDVAEAQGQLAEAARAYGESLAIRKKLAAGDPSNTLLQRDVMVTYDRLGDLSLARNHLEEAEIVYNETLWTFKKLAAGDPSNAEFQHDLWVAYSKIGRVAEAQGKPEKAAQAYSESLPIAKKLAAGDPSNKLFQRILSLAYFQLAGVAEAQGQLAEAERAYGESLTITKALAAGDPSNAEWQRDLWVAIWRLADLAERQNKISEAKNYLKQAFDVISGLEKRGLHLSTEDQENLETLRRKLGVVAP